MLSRLSGASGSMINNSKFAGHAQKLARLMQDGYSRSHVEADTQVNKM